MQPKLKSPSPLTIWTTDNTPGLSKLAEEILTDIFDLIPDYVEKDFLRDLATLKRRTEHEGITFLTTTLPNLFKGFLSFLETGTGAYGSFAINRATGHPLFLGELFRLACVGDEKGIQAFRALYQMCVWFKKVRGPYSKAILKKSKDEFVATDQLIGKLDFDNEFDELIIERASDLVYDVFSCIESQGKFGQKFKPRPGPGATNTPSHIYERYAPRKLGDIETEMLLYDWMYYDYQSLHDHVSKQNIIRMWEQGYEPYKSRLKAVPKTFGKPRLICIEENEMQFLQQGLKSLMYEIIESHPLTQGRVNFTRQEINQALALESSVSRTNSTIDMSEASDRISKTLVRKIFRKCPIMLYYLETLSTKVITIDNEDYHCEKFSPMGSGICFPVMSIVHWSLIRAIMELSSDSESHTDSLHVYGDDIIISSKSHDAITSILPRFGMKLNTNKSYVMSSFRESCGMDAYNGTRVTPVYLKYIPTIAMGPAATMSTLAVENQLYEAGYLRTARAIRGMTAVTGYSEIGTPPLSWKRTNLSTVDVSGRRRFNRSLQAQQYRVRLIVSKNDDDERVTICEEQALLRYYLQHAEDHDDKWAHLDLKFKWGWVSDHDFYNIKVANFQVKKAANLVDRRPMGFIPKFFCSLFFHSDRKKLSI